MTSLSSHVLDTTAGKPFAGLTLTLTCPDGSTYQAKTDSDGRCRDWGEVQFSDGDYQLRFHCQQYLLDQHGESFYPFVDIHFTLSSSGGHYHVPLLISPYGFSSYRGS